jgi:hypothetical protein
MPSVAVRYALQDAILDHGNGEGTWGELFCAAVESAAFVVKDMRTLIDIGLSYIPIDCGVAKAIRCAIEAHDKGMDYKQARDNILQDHRGRPGWGCTSKEDLEKGFNTGTAGYDVPSNIAILVYGLLHGKDDFDKMICTTVNMGEDTDCTGATAGSIFGIMHGTKGMPQKWIDPIGRSIKTVTLNLCDFRWDHQLARTVDELTERVEKVAMHVVNRYIYNPVEIAADKPTTLTDFNASEWFDSKHGAGAMANMRGPVFRFDFFSVAVDYGESPAIRDGEEKTIGFTIDNSSTVQANIAVRWYLPDGWKVSPSTTALFLSHSGGPWASTSADLPRTTLRFALSTDKVLQPVNRCVLELTIDGRPAVMLVPIILTNGNVTAEMI